MAKLTVWLTICTLVALTTYVRSRHRVPLDVVRSGFIGLILGSVIYSFLAIASLPFDAG